MTQPRRRRRTTQTRASPDPAVVRQAILALEGTTFEDFQFPLPGDLRDLVKGADLVSSTIEDRVPELLNRVRDHTWDVDQALAAYEFRRAAAGFPDCLLAERADPDHVIFEIETKSWYVLSRDTITARFLTDPAAITPGTLVIIASWALDGVVSGSPKILRIHIDDAHTLAAARDASWTAQAHRRVLPAQNAPGTPRNLRRTQVTPQQQRNGTWEAESQNFGKIHRIRHQPVKDFIENTLDLQAAGKTFRDWRSFIHS